jgi:hypothetical protein
MNFYGFMGAMAPAAFERVVRVAIERNNSSSALNLDTAAIADAWGARGSMVQLEAIPL